MLDSDERINFELLGEYFTIRSDVPEDYFMKLVHYIQSKVDSVKKESPSLSHIKALIFASLDMADELFKTKEGLLNEDAVKIISDLSSSLASAIEEE